MRIQGYRASGDDWDAMFERQGLPAEVVWNDLAKTEGWVLRRHAKIGTVKRRPDGLLRATDALGKPVCCVASATELLQRVMERDDKRIANAEAA